MKYLFACATDIGTTKSKNQDAVLIKKGIFDGRQIVLAVMCDGMGGLEKGEVASASLISAFSVWFGETLPALLERPAAGREIPRSWNRLIAHMNERMREYGRLGGLQLGTTLTAILFREEEYDLVHVGDSRAYEITDRICQLTKDQTLVQREVDRGKLTAQEAKRDARRSVLLQCVGVAPDVEPACLKGRIAPDAVYLLCCDGFWHMISSREMRERLSPERMTSEAELGRALEDLIALSKKRGESDNISAIAIRTRRGENGHA